jgi:vacuolar protein sorting-associated protein 52
VERHLGPSVEDLYLSPVIVKKIVEGSIDETWPKALEEVERRYYALRVDGLNTNDTKAIDDYKPLLEKIREKVSKFGASRI